MVSSVRADIYLEPSLYFKVLGYMDKKGISTVSKAVNSLMKDHFSMESEHEMAINRLTTVIQKYEMRVKNLEYELREAKKYDNIL